MAAALLLVGAIAWSIPRANAQAFPPPDPIPGEVDLEGGQYLTQGPLHEAFAEPVVFNPEGGPVIPQAPPAPIAELPPDQKPEGDHVVWIPGYWSWDETRDDFVWVSGLWRATPPNREWLPGYWTQVSGDFQWVPGYWDSDQEDEVVYLPAPPPSLEQGPNAPPAIPDATWTPGVWIWQGNQYAWRPGYWVNPQPDWVWTPDQYSWTPNGYVFNRGYWDYPIANRGTAFAPVYFPRPVYNRPGFQLSPAVGLLTSSLLSNLFVRSANRHYYFGDYYDQRFANSGYRPWHTFNSGRNGYDPLYSYAQARNHGNAGWANGLRDAYQYRVQNANARPPRTFSELRRVAARPANGNLPRNAALAQDLVMARPLQQLAQNPGPNGQVQRFQKIDQARRQELAQKTAQVQHLREERRRLETQVARANHPGNSGNPGPAAPRRVAKPRAPGAPARVNANANVNGNPNVNRPASNPGPGQVHAANRPHPPAAPHPNANKPPATQGRPHPGAGPGAGGKPHPGPAAGVGPKPGGGSKPGAGKPGGGKPKAAAVRPPGAQGGRALHVVASPKHVPNATRPGAVRVNRPTAAAARHVPPASRPTARVHPPAPKARPARPNGPSKPAGRKPPARKKKG